MHLQPGGPDEEARPHERALGLVVTQHVADVLAQEALDALAVFLHPFDILLLPPPVFLRDVVGWGERSDRLVDLVIPRHVRHEVADERECAHGLDGDRLLEVEIREACLAGEARPAVDLGAARPALGSLAVPADGEVGRRVALDPMEGVEDDHPFLHGDVELVEPTLRPGAAAEDLQVCVGHRCLRRQ